MNRLSLQRSSARWLAAAVATGIGVLHVSNAAESPPATTNAPSVTLDALVADVLEHNPELNFYRAEMAAAKGERRTAATWANPEVSTTAGQKQVRSGGLSDEGFAWSVSVQQTFEWPGRIPLRKAIANHQINSSRARLRPVPRCAGRPRAHARLQSFRGTAIPASAGPR